MPSAPNIAYSLRYQKGHVVCLIRVIRSNEFNELNDTYKTETVLKATFLAERFTEQAYIRLYSLDQVYIEVFFDSRTHLIINFRAFENTMFLMPYLKDIRINI